MNSLDFVLRIFAQGFILLTPKVTLKVKIMRKFHIKTYGCQMNVYDSRLMQELLSDHGFVPVENELDADVVILNTCAVRRKAEVKAIDHARYLRHRGKFVVIVGCVARERAQALVEDGSADAVLAHRAYVKLPEVIEKGMQLVDVSDRHGTLLEFTPLPLRRRKTTFSEFVTIMEGCDNFCSYCIVPYTRGREISRPAQDIVQEINNLERQGVIEITLLGQNVNSYFDGEHDFSALLDLVASKTSLYRIRYTTLNPRDVSIKMLRVIAHHLPRLTDWLHLPLQAGSTKVLRDMRRGYTKEEFIEMVENVRRILPEAVITTDIMVGFPTETEEDFLETIDMVRKVEFDHAFTFIYSPRPKTRAYRWEDLPYQIKSARLRRLIEEVDRIARKKREAMLGKVFEVLVERPSEKDPSVAMGRTRGFIAVVLDRWVEPGEVVKAKITEIKGLTPIGKVVK